MESPRHSCFKLELPNPPEPDKIEPIFIKATWYDTHFDLSIREGGWRELKGANRAELQLSWTFEREGTKLEWRWKCQPSPNPKQTNSGILNFLMDANIRLSEEVVRKTKSFERLEVEIEKCLAQSESFSNEKTEFESAVYARFLSVLNSKKGKLRELGEQLVKAGVNGGKSPEEDKESTKKTDPFDEGSYNEVTTEKSGTGTSEDVQKGKSCSRKRIALK
ncbi:DNA repair protein XRCC4-like [Punica granatum]|uniref:DNA repair protein XRCC4-like n=1 Tax=Punica granatum TaxID=22663 RepID=A0A6P8D7J3_PUNGR|nr:DNA repair protein XRCC4-like [Punica granatum]